MAQYLHIRVEDIDLLLPALQVHEVVGMDRLEVQADGHVLWREQVIPARDGGQILQRCEHVTQRNYGVVYSPDNSDAPPLLLTIDEVLGLRQPQAGQLHRLPHASPNAQHMFDAVWINSAGTKAYCLRSELNPALFV